MRPSLPSRQDPADLCGTPGVPGPVTIPPELARIWRGELPPAAPPGDPGIVQSRPEAPPALPFILGPLAVFAAMLLLSGWRRLRRAAPGAAASGTLDAEVAAPAEEPPSAPEVPTPGSETEVIPIRSGHRRREGEEKPDKPIVVTLGGRRPPAQPVTVRLPHHTASLLRRGPDGSGDIPAKEPPAGPQEEEAERTGPNRHTGPDRRRGPLRRTGRSWWITD